MVRAVLGVHELLRRPAQQGVLDAIAPRAQCVLELVVSEHTRRTVRRRSAAVPALIRTGADAELSVLDVRADDVDVDIPLYAAGVLRVGAGAAGVVGDVLGGELLVVVLNVHQHAEGELLEIAGTGGLAGFLTSSGEHR